MVDIPSFHDFDRNGLCRRCRHDESGGGSLFDCPVGDPTNRVIAATQLSDMRAIHHAFRTLAVPALAAWIVERLESAHRAAVEAGVPV